MAFKSIETYNDERYRFQFRLTKDGESANVIFLYRSKSDMLIGPAHYVMSPEYRGYVECCEVGCPACAKGIRKDVGMLFIPLYNLDTQKIEFWVKSQSFENYLDRCVFDSYPNPSEYVFTITRHGEYKAEKVTYDIRATYNNSVMTYDQILAKFNTTLDWPGYYANICRSYSISELEHLLSNRSQSNSTSSSGLSDYVATPRAGFVPTMPETYVDASNLVADNTPVVTAPTVSNTEVSDDSTPDVGDDFPDPEF